MASRATWSGARRRGRTAREVAAPISSLTVALRQVGRDLAVLRVPYALVGGLAVSARAEPRLTRDVYIAIAAEDNANAERVIRELLDRGYRLRATVEQTRTGRLATARLNPPVRTQLVLDVLFASCGIEAEIVDQAEKLEILPRVRIPVARASHLVAMKLLARDDRARPQDLDDIRALLATMPAGERKLVPPAIKLIAARGFARGRDLAAAWREVSKPP